MFNVSPVRLRTRVLWLNSAFAVLLVAITAFLMWQSQRSQQRWSRLVGVDTKAVRALDEVLRSHNGFHARFGADPSAAERYRDVEQLLESAPLREIDISSLGVRMNAYRTALENGDVAEAGRESVRVANTASSMIAKLTAQIDSQIPALERGSRTTIIAGLAIVWIVVVLSFAVTTYTYRRVVRPIEQLSAAADAIERGEPVTAPVGGDAEIRRLGIAFNKMAEKLKAHARTDELTSLPNFRAFRERIDAEIARASRYDMCFGILVLDLDRFKKYNDTYGHLAGNDALQRVARALREAVRQVDFPARYGGEEFAVIMPQADADALSHVGERILAGVEALPAPPGGASVTVSIGAASYPSDGTTAEALFHAADERLYQAKREGRNRVVVMAAPRAVQSAG